MFVLLPAPFFIWCNALAVHPDQPQHWTYLLDIMSVLSGDILRHSLHKISEVLGLSGTKMLSADEVLMLYLIWGILRGLPWTQFYLFIYFPTMRWLLPNNTVLLWMSVHGLHQICHKNMSKCNRGYLSTHIHAGLGRSMFSHSPPH